MNENTVPAENQVSDTVYSLGNSGTRVLILGNSITLHGRSPDIGWYQHCGMAASCPEKDYVHLLYEKADASGFEVSFLIVQAAEWERNFWKNDILSKFDAARDFNPDIIIFRLGENITRESCDEHNLTEAIARLICYFSSDSGAKTIFTTCFWRHEKADVAVLAINPAAVDLGDLGDDDSMKAIGLFDHGGVAAHPGDKGMENIAGRILAALENLIK